MMLLREELGLPRLTCSKLADRLHIVTVGEEDMEHVHSHRHIRCCLSTLDLPRECGSARYSSAVESASCAWFLVEWWKFSVGATLAQSILNGC